MPCPGRCDSGKASGDRPHAGRGLGGLEPSPHGKGGAYEIRFDDAVPEKVAINEAVELARKFGGDESPVFVNGILAKLV